jgi:hypothetical protein
MKSVFIALAILCTSTAFAQNFTYYAAAKAGLSMREQPNTSAKVLEKIAYGEKLATLADTAKGIPITTEGFDGWWWKIKYNNKIGYVVNTYLLPIPPPKATVHNMKDYMAQVSSPAGAAVTLKRNDEAAEGVGSTLKKQLYKNGMEWHETSGYEYGSEVAIIPDITVEQAFIIVRLLNEYPNMIGEKDPMPTKNTTIKKDAGDKTFTIEKELWNDKFGPMKHITITSTEGAATILEIYLLNEQVVINYSSGV